MNEQQIIRSLFFDSEGARLPGTAYIDEVSEVGYLYEPPGKPRYFGKKDGEKMDGITDTRGNYLYFRYNGNTEVGDRLATVPLLAVLVLNRPGSDPKRAALGVTKWLGSSKYVQKPIELIENTQQIFEEETGEQFDQWRSRKVLYAFRFFVRYPVNLPCNELSISPTETNCC